MIEEGLGAANLSLKDQVKNATQTLQKHLGDQLSAIESVQGDMETRVKALQTKTEESNILTREHMIRLHLATGREVINYAT